MMTCLNPVKKRVKFRIQKRENPFEIPCTSYALYLLTEDDFKIYLENFVNALLSDNDTEVFGKYFQTWYAPPDRVRKWTYAFRRHTGINCNMYLESLH